LPESVKFSRSFNRCTYSIKLEFNIMLVEFVASKMLKNRLIED